MKITINIYQDLKQATQAYNDHYNGGVDKKVTKKKLAEFFSALVESDLEAITIVKNED